MRHSKFQQHVPASTTCLIQCGQCPCMTAVMVCSVQITFIFFTKNASKFKYQQGCLKVKQKEANVTEPLMSHIRFLTCQHIL